MRVVVTGGTGLVGRALVQTLVERGDEVCILSRSAGNPAPGVTHVVWTPGAGGQWQRAIDGADAVVHLAGASVADERWTDARKRELRSSRIDSTKLVVEAIANASRRPRALVCASAVGWYGVATADRVVTEDSPPGTDFLATLCVDWEAAANEACGIGVRVALARFGLVLSKHGGVYEKMRRAFRAFVGGPLGSGRQYMPWVHVHDVVRALDAMIRRDSFCGAYNVTAPEPVTMERFAEELGRSLGRPALARVPAFALRALVGSEAATAILTGQRAIPDRLIKEGFEFVFPEVRSALADLAGH